MLISYVLGQTSIILRVKIPNTSKTDNSGVTGLTNSTTGLSISTAADNEASATVYTSASSHIQTIATLGTFAAPSASNCRFKEFDSTNHPGIYEIQLDNSRYNVASSKSLLITINAITASNAAQVDVLIPLTSVNPYDSVAFGLSSLSNLFIHSGTAQSGNATSIKLDNGASSTSNIYNGNLITITGGTGAGQTRTITAYNGSSNQATVDRAFITTPNNTSIFAIIATDNPTLNANLQVTANVSQAIIRSGTAQAGANQTITLDSGASASNNIYNGNLITITGGTGLGQSRTIISYVGSTKIATIDRVWAVNPDNTSTFNILASITPSVFSDQGVAQSATSSTITLQNTASSTNNIFNGSILTILGGTDAGDTVQVTGYVGSTKVATVTPNFAVTPDNTSSYAIIPAITNDNTGTPAPTVAQITTAIWSDLLSSSDFSTSGSIGALLNSNVAAIKSDTGTILTDVNTGAGAIFSRIGAPVGASISSDIAAVKANLVAGVNISQWLGNNVFATTNGIPDVNVKNYNNQLAVTDANNLPKVDLEDIKGSASAGAAGYVGIDWANINAPLTTINLSGTTIGTITTYTNNTPQTGDSFALIGTTGSGLTSLAQASTALSTANWTTARSVKLDNLDAAISTRSTFSGGAVLSVTNAITLPSIPANWITATGIAASALNGKGDWLTPSGTLAEVTLVDTLTTYTNNTPQTGDSFARLGAPAGASIAADISGDTTKLNTLITNTDTIIAGVTVSDKTGYSLAADGLDSITAETGVNIRQAIALILDDLCAKISGSPTSPITVRDINDTVDRIVVHFDSNNNRTSTTLTPPS